MKGNKILRIVFSSMILMNCLVGYMSFLGQIKKADFGWDARLRHNEILCSHTLTNPYHVWDGTRFLPGFQPYWPQCDPKFNCNPIDRCVHAYPVWHTVFFWFYGWLPDDYFMGIMASVFGVCLCVIAIGTYKLMQRATDDPLTPTLGILALIACSMMQCFLSQNYSVMILALLILGAMALRRDRQVLAGVCWAVTMIKPQLAILFVWPLLIGRKIKVILVAALLCLLSAVLMASVYDEPLLELILQIPKAVKPYSIEPLVVTKFFAPLLGGAGNYVWMALCGMMCGMLCWFGRKQQDWIYRAMPVVLFIPVWTYNMPYDGVVEWIWYVGAFGMAVASGCRANIWRCYLLVAIICSQFCHFWDIAICFRLFNPAGLGWIYRALSGGNILLAFAMFIHLVRERHAIRIENH